MYNSKYVGKRIRVNKAGNYRNTVINITGATGTVCGVWGADNIGVRLDGLTNVTSKHGYFYFNITDLEFIDPEKTEIKNDKGVNEMPKLENYLNVALVQFLDDPGFRTYEYANYDPDLQVGDYCVVMSASHGMGMAVVEEIKPSTSNALYREIVAKFDTTAYNARVEQRKKAAELKAKMQERAKQLQDLVLFQTLAKEDEDMAKLLAEYKSLV